MSVPDVPKNRPQMLYFFPGLQNVDWIPKVDPEPTSKHPFDIIQPVLQYPGTGLFGKKWALKSWYVTVNAGALYSTPITVEEGDSILCNMTRTGPTSFEVVGTLASEPTKATKQSCDNKARLDVQPWAYSAVTECYGCDGCDTFPTKPITFTENRLYQGTERLDEGLEWKVNPKPPKKFECHEMTTVASNGDATTTFQ